MAAKKTAKKGARKGAKRSSAKKGAAKKGGAKKSAKSGARKKTAKRSGAKRTPNAAFMKAMTPSAQLATVVGDPAVGAKLAVTARRIALVADGITVDGVPNPPSGFDPSLLVQSGG